MENRVSRRRLVKLLYEKALSLSPKDRNAFLDRNCNDLGIRNSVQEMLEESELDFSSSSQSSRRPNAVASKRTPKSMPVPGRYRRHERIGRGGMGVVFRAEQIETSNRVVALKYIFPKRFGNKKRVSAFKTEIANLSKLNHPNIATIYEAGEVQEPGGAEGIPFFSMEYVKNGVPITEYCDDHLLDVRGRLKLFIQVCRGVQHAHTGGIVHRDLKPSNILVSGLPSDPQVKIIDFGLSSSVGDDAITGNACGTPAYASPEQASSGELAKAPSDIFSLGSILQELLIGFNHLGHNRKLVRSFFDLLCFYKTKKIIGAANLVQDLSPDQLGAVIGKRKTSKPKLIRILRTDLSWILKKCLQLKPEDRYDSVKSLEVDVQNFLDCKPVEARERKNFSYVWGKGLRRNAAVSIAITIAFLFLIGLVESMRRINIQERVRVQEANRATLVERSLRKESEKNRKNAENGFNSLAGIFEKLDIRNPPKSYDGWTARFAKEISKAGEKLDRDIFDRSLNYAKMLDRFSSVLVGLGDGKNAVKLARKSLAIFEELPEISPEDKTRSLYNLGTALMADSKFLEGTEVFSRCLGQMKKQLDSENQDLLRCETNLATCLANCGRYDEAIAHYKTVIPKLQENFSRTDRETLAAQGNYANCCRQLGEIKDAKEIFEKIIPLFTKHHGMNYYGTITSEINLGFCLNELGEYNRCIDMLSKTLPRAKKHLGSMHPHTVKAITFLSTAMKQRGEKRQALELLKTVELRNEDLLNEKHLENVFIRIGDLYSQLGDHNNAIQVQKFILKSTNLSTDHRKRLSLQSNLGITYGKAGKEKLAINISEQTVEEAVQRFGDKEPLAIIFSANLAFVYDLAKKANQAEKLYVDVLEKSQRHSPLSTHGIFVQNYVRKLRSEKRLGEAIVQLKKLHQLIENEGGKKSLLANQIETKLLFALIESSRFVEAAKMAEKYEGLAWSELRDKAPRFLKALGRVGQYHFENKNFSKSIPIFEKILKVKESGIAKVDMKSLYRTKLNLAANYKASGRVKESIPLYEELFSQLNEFPEDGKAVRNSLCDAYFRCKMGNKAREVVVEILKPVRRKHKNNFNMFHYSLGAIARKLTNSGGYQQSRELLEESMDLILKEQPNHSRLFYTKILLGENCYFDAVNGPKNRLKSDVTRLLKEAKRNLVDGFEGMKGAKNLPFNEQARRVVLIDAAKSLIKVLEEIGEKRELAKWRSILKALERGR